MADQVGGDLSQITADHVFLAARAGDGVCISVVRDTAQYVGMAVSNMAAVLDPETIVLGGMLATSGAQMLDAIRVECSRRLRPAQAVACPLSSRRSGPTPPAIGAARAAMVGRNDFAGRCGHCPARSRHFTWQPPLEGERIAAIESRVIDTPAGCERLDVAGFTILPGFVDVHVHGVAGHDVLDGAGADRCGGGSAAPVWRYVVLPHISGM